MLYTIPELLRELRVKGVELRPEGDAIRVIGSPSPLLAEEIRRLKPPLLPMLQRERARALAAFIDGPAPYEERIVWMPEYRDLCERIAEYGAAHPGRGPEADAL